MTFKEWFNQLSKESQDWLMKEDPWWFDATSDDLYSHLDTNKTIQFVLKNLDTSVLNYSAVCKTRWWGIIHDIHTNWNSDAGIIGIVKYLYDMRKADPNFMSEQEFEKIIMAAKKRSGKYMYCFIDDINKRKDIYKQFLVESEYNLSYGINLLDLIFIQDDYSSFDYTLANEANLILRNESRAPNCMLRELFTQEKIVSTYRDNPKDYRINRNTIHDEVFDELFFCENGWQDDEKLAVLCRNYSSCTEDMLDFIKRVVSVEHKYLRCIETWIRQNTPLAAELYSLRKPKEQLTGNESTQQQFRLSTDIRKIIQVAACCKRKNVGKAMLSNLGAVGSLLKLYSYKFDDIYNCMYPEDEMIKVGVRY